MNKKSGLFPLLGMTHADELIYTALLELGTATLTELAERAHLHRQEVYRALPTLISRGVLLEAKRGRRPVYTACDPKYLLQLYEEKRTAVEEKLEEFADIARNPSKRPIVTYGEGRAAIHRVYADLAQTLPRKGMYFRYSAKDARERERKQTPRNFVAIRDAKQFERLVITNEVERSRKRNLLGREIRVIPKDFDLFEDNVSQVIYGNKVAIIDLNSKTAITIENPTIARFQEKLFRLLFRHLK